MSKILLLSLLLCTLSLINCGKLFFREIDCREFELGEEYYWFNSNNGDSVIFTSQSNMELAFIVGDKWIEHRTQYTSDTGCGCLDLSGMILSNESDTITLINQLTYVEDNNGTRYETLILTINGGSNEFHETSIITLPTYSIEDASFSNVKKFEKAETENPNIQSLYLAENLGIIQIEMMDGTTWTNSDLAPKNPTELTSFRFETNKCE
jgi:hypothetical protein